MVRNRFLLLVQGLFLCAFLVAGAYTLSIFQDYGMRLFKEKSMLQTSYAAKQLTESLNKGASREQLEAESAELAKEMEIKLRLLDVADSDVSEAVRAYLGGGMGASVRSDEQGDLRTLYLAEPLGGRLILQAAFPLKRFAAEYDKVRVFVLVAFVFLMLLAAVLARFLVLKMLQPFEEIEAAAQKMAQGNSTLRLQRNVSDEFAALSHALNTMAESIESKKDELAREKRKLELIMNNTDNSIVTIDKRGMIIDCNEQFGKLFGKEAVGRHYLQLVNNLAIEDLLGSALATDAPVSRNLSASSLHGKKSFQVFGTPLKAPYNNEPNSVFFVFHDISALQVVYEKQSEFVSNASHELATPLTTIRGFTEILLGQDAPEDAGLRQKFLDIILKESERMQALLRDLLQLARLDSEEYRRSISMEALEPGEVMNKVGEEFRRRVSERDLILEIIQPRTAVTVMANTDWLKQVLVNLLENALKYTPAGGVITISCQREKQFAVFRVHNTGEGISRQDAARIFDRFYRIDKARTRQIGGTGLGLSIVKFIVEIFGGRIFCESGPGEGVAFVFTVPLAGGESFTPEPSA